LPEAEALAIYVKKLLQVRLGQGEIGEVAGEEKRRAGWRW
jgi:hypothetical protein